MYLTQIQVDNVGRTVQGIERLSKKANEDLTKKSASAIRQELKQLLGLVEYALDQLK